MSPQTAVKPNDASVIGLVGLAHGTSHFFHLMLPPLFPWLMKDFSLSFTDVGLLTTTFFDLRLRSRSRRGAFPKAAQRSLLP